MLVFLTLSSANSLSIDRVGILVEDFPNFNTCLVVFQYQLEFVLVDSKLSRLSKVFLFRLSNFRYYFIPNNFIPFPK